MLNADNDPVRYFFDGGLRFSCTRCGRCCTGGPGRVGFSEEEARRMSRVLGLAKDEFLLRYTRRDERGPTLKETADGACIFLGPEGCRVYSARPAQCRCFPFWTRNLRSPEAWRSAACSCPGIGSGRLHGRRRILHILSQSPV